MHSDIDIYIQFYCMVKIPKYKIIIIAVADFICDNTAIKQIEYCTKINLMFFTIDVIFELCNVCYPLFIRCISREFSIKNIFCSMCWISIINSTAITVVLDI